MTPEDWRQVHQAYRAFIVQVRMIVQHARDRSAGALKGEG